MRLLLFLVLSFRDFADSSQVSARAAARGRNGLDIQAPEAPEPPDGPLRRQGPPPGRQLAASQAGGQTATSHIFPLRWQEAAGGCVTRPAEPRLPAAASVPGPSSRTDSQS